MTMTRDKIILELLLVVLLSYQRRFRASLGIRNLRLPMWCPEPTRNCISYSSTRPLSSSWMTCVSLPPEEGGHLHLLPQLPQQLRLQLQLPPPRLRTPPPH